MIITWHGLNCFSLKGDQVTVVTDPYSSESGLKIPRLNADIVTISHPQYRPNENFPPETRLIDWPGEYEIHNIFLKTVKIPSSAPDTLPIQVFTIDIDDMTIAHLSDLNQKLTNEITEEIGEVDILLIPVGGKDTLTAALAHEVIEQIDPKIIIPMHYQIPGLSQPCDPLDRFVKEMGIPQVIEQENYKIKKSQLPTASTEIIILKPKL